MPKIIENLKDRLLTEAKQQIEESGYGAMTIRSIAKGCGVGVGTVYNSFPSKDDLIAALLLEDWKGCIQAIGAASSGSDAPRPVVLCMYEQLTGYVRRHEKIFYDEAAAAAFAGSVSRYHGLLRGQLARPLRRFCGDEFTAEFIAESLLTWSMAGKDFDRIYQILEKLF